MKQTYDIANDIKLIDEVRACAENGVRDLQELELGWVAGGDPSPSWDGSTTGP